MLIECPFCHATAKLPDEKEGAKVRCSECSKVYVAHEQGTKAKAAAGLSPAAISIIAALVVGAAGVAWVANSRSKPKPPPPPPPPPPVEAPVVDASGWDGEYVKFVRGIYDASVGLDEQRLVGMLDGPRIAKRLAEADPTKAVDYAALGPVEQQAFVAQFAQEFMRGTDEHSPHLWQPVDGGVLKFDLLDVVVRVTVDKRLAPGSTELAESRTYDWNLVRPDDKSKWKAWSWERFLSDEEKRALRTRKSKVTRVELADGTKLFQADITRLEPYPGTPPEQIAHIEKLMATMLDLSLTKESNRARDELVALGKPAIPLLLNKFCDLKLVDAEDDPSLIQANMVYLTLQRITGYDPGFTAMPGQTEERRTVAIKAYFAWWERKGKNFTAAPEPGKDLLEEMIVPTERDKKEIEKEKAKTGGGR